MPSDPIQQFIQNYMGFKQFEAQQQSMLEQQRQFDLQLAQQQRQQDGQEVQNFAVLLSKVQHPGEALALGEAFSQRNPELEGIFRPLSHAIAPSLETQMEGAAQRAGPMAAEQALAIKQSRALGAPDLQQGEQFEATFGETRRQFDQQFAQRNKEFIANYGLDVRRAGQQDRALGQQDRSLDLQGAELAQRGELGQLNALVSAGRLPNQMRGSLSQAAVRLQSQLNNQFLHPAERQRLERELRDVNTQIGRLDTEIAGQGAGKNAATGGMTPAQLTTAVQVAWQDVSDAKSPGERAAAIQRYNQLATAMGLSPLNLERGPLGGHKAGIDTTQVR